MAWVTKVPAHDVDKLRVPLRRPDCRQVPDQPDRGADDPQTKAKANRGSERAVDDRDGARRTAEKDRFGQSAMDWRIETDDGLSLFHQTSAPPPNWKKDRKKLDAAKAIDRPKTI